MTRADLTRYAVAGIVGTGALWLLTSLFIFAFSPEMGTP